MKNMWKYILIGLIVALIELVFVANFGTLINGSTMETAVVLATGAFLAFEMVICTGVIVNYLKKVDEREK